jgi:condensin complex subunit 3
VATRSLSTRKVQLSRLVYASIYILTLFPAAEEAEKKDIGVNDDDDALASRFTARLLRFLLKGFLAKDKTVRYRVLQIIAEVICYLGEIK